MRRASIGPVLLMLLTASLFGLDLIPSARAGTLFVGGAGPGNYTTIQEAIDAASDRDMVFVHNGTYRENLLIGKTITLVGEDRYGTIIDGGGAGDVVRVEADEVFIESFTVRNSGHGKAGISFNSDWGQASRNLIVNNYLGVVVSFYASAGIADNEFRDITSDAVLGDGATSVGVGGNAFIDEGVVIGGLGTSMVVGNLFLGGGVYLGGIDGMAPYWCVVCGNQLVNGASIGLSYTSDCAVSANTIVSGGISLWRAGGTTLHHNNFVDSEASDFNNDGYLNRTNWWDDGSEGNYWSDYTGVDADGDGIGDTPYVIDEDSQDNYPLMSFRVGSPSPPRDLKGWAGIQRATLAWREPLLDGGSPVTNYSIYRRTKNQSFSLLAEIGNATAYTDLSVTPGETYYYAVSAKNSVREGSKSDSVMVQVSTDVLTLEDRARNPWVGRISVNSTPPMPPIPGKEDRVPSSDDDISNEVPVSPPPRELSSGFRQQRELRRMF